ncbi:hypothetical protein RLIN73S_00695 [Rhodanobacter lindaniclasticus]
MDYKFHFFAWWQDHVNAIDPTGVPLAPDLVDYFTKLSDEDGIALAPAQKAWYAKKSEEQGDKMKQEHPSTPEEAFEQAIEGAYFARELGKPINSCGCATCPSSRACR